MIRRVTREEVDNDKRMTLIRIFLFLVLFVIVVLMIFTSGKVRTFLNLYVT